MQIGSTPTPLTVAPASMLDTNDPSNAPTPGAEDQERTSTTSQEYVPATPMTSRKDYFNSIEGVFEAAYRRYLEVYYTTPGADYVNPSCQVPAGLAYPGYMVSPYGCTNPGIIYNTAVGYPTSPLPIAYPGYVDTTSSGYYITSPVQSYDVGNPIAEARSASTGSPMNFTSAWETRPRMFGE